MGILDFLFISESPKQSRLKIQCLDEDGSVNGELSPKEYGYNSLRWAFDLAVGALNPIASGKLSAQGFISEELAAAVNANKAVYLARTMGIFCGGYSHYLFGVMSHEIGLVPQERAVASVQIEKGLLDGANNWFGPTTTSHRKGEYDSFLGTLRESQAWYTSEWGPCFFGNGNMPANKWPCMLNSRHTSYKQGSMISDTDLWQLGTLLSPP